MTTRLGVDRAARVRDAMVTLVAEHGIHGASMSQVARLAGVATGTAYVHYESKQDLLIAAFVEVKSRIGQATVEGINVDDPHSVFQKVWRNVYSYLKSNPAMARFLVQVEVSPLRGLAHEALAQDDPLTETASTLAEHLVVLLLLILYDLSLAPAVRLAASDQHLTPAEMDTLIESCWREVRR